MGDILQGFGVYFCSLMQGYIIERTVPSVFLFSLDPRTSNVREPTVLPVIALLLMYPEFVNLAWHLLEVYVEFWKVQIVDVLFVPE